MARDQPWPRTERCPGPREPGTPISPQRYAATKGAADGHGQGVDSFRLDRTPDPETHVADDSAVSADDEDIEALGEVGIPVVERILGGTIIKDELS